MNWGDEADALLGARVTGQDVRKVAPATTPSGLPRQTGRTFIEPPEDAPAPAKPFPIAPAAEELHGAARALAPPSMGESAARGGLQGLTSGWSDELAARIDQGVSKIPGVRTVADQFRAPGAPPLTDPSVSYDERRDFYRGLNSRAQAANPKTYLAGNVAGGVAQQAIPGVGALPPAVGGAVAGLGYSDATDAKGAIDDTTNGALLGAGGAALGKAVSTGAKAVASSAPARVVGREISKLGEGVKKSLRAQLATPQVERKVANIIATDAAVKKALQSPADLVAAADTGIEKATEAGKPIYQAADEAAAEARAAAATGKSVDEAPGFTIPKAEPIGKGGIPREDIESVFDRAARKATSDSEHPHMVSTIERLKDQFMTGIGKDEFVPSYEVRKFLSKQLQRPAFGGDPNVDPTAAKEATQRLAIGVKNVLDEHVLTHAPQADAVRLIGTGGINDQISAYHVIGNVAQEQMVNKKVPGIAGQIAGLVDAARSNGPAVIGGLAGSAVGHPALGAAIGYAAGKAPAVIDRIAASPGAQTVASKAPALGRALMQPTIEALTSGDRNARRAAVHREVFGR